MRVTAAAALFKTIQNTHIQDGATKSAAVAAAACHNNSKQ